MRSTSTSVAMSPESLNRFLNDAINTYLRLDNPEPKKLTEHSRKGYLAFVSNRASGLFSSSGASGRLRAQKYRERINSADFLQKTDAELLAVVYKDLLNDGSDSPLYSSSKLRARLIDAIVLDHCKVGQDDVTRELNTYRQQVAVCLGSYAPQAIPTIADCRRIVMLGMINQKVSADHQVPFHSIINAAL